MKKYTKEKLKAVLDLHVRWVNGEEGGELANLQSTFLTVAATLGRQRLPTPRNGAKPLFSLQLSRRQNELRILPE